MQDSQFYLQIAVNMIQNNLGFRKYGVSSGWIGVQYFSIWMGQIQALMGIGETRAWTQVAGIRTVLVKSVGISASSGTVWPAMTFWKISKTLGSSIDMQVTGTLFVTISDLLGLHDGPQVTTEGYLLKHTSSGPKAPGWFV